jgi:hypothetical protein
MARSVGDRIGETRAIARHRLGGQVDRRIRGRRGAAEARQATGCGVHGAVGEFELGPIGRREGQVAVDEPLVGEAGSSATRMMLPALFAILASPWVRNSPCIQTLTTG